MAVVDSDGDVDIARSDELRQSMLERMTLILDTFQGGSTALTNAEIVGRTQLPRSTVHRILEQLVRSGWVVHTSFGYRLGSRAGRLGGGSNNEIRSAAAPLLHDLHLRTGMIVHLAVLDGSDSLCLDKVGGRFATSLPSRVGGRSPAYATVDGRSMLAWLARESIDRLFQDRPSCCTDRAIPDISALHHQLDRIRRHGGLAIDWGESVRGVACVGVAVRGAAGPIAGIALCGEAHTAQLERVAPLVVSAAQEVSWSLAPELGNDVGNVD
ncbi:IclR family transcriptional regulator [Rhodococcus sp. ACT016]|uniref:IclR family transcriptional regulator n=1 Tax=Rhodococcus sp. ACT016 TaxID=3134808 RepID=UPI003D2B0765